MPYDDDFNTVTTGDNYADLPPPAAAAAPRPLASLSASPSLSMSPPRSQPMPAAAPLMPAPSPLMPAPLAPLMPAPPAPLMSAPPAPLRPAPPAPSPLMPAPLVPAPPFIPEGAAVAPPRDPAFFADPPPTHIQRPEVHADRPFTPPKLFPVPEIPEPGLVNAARYAVRFGRARWQRRGAIRILGAEIKQDTESLELVLGALGRVAREVGVDGRVFSAENAAISAAEERIAALVKEQAEVEGRRADENSKFIDIEAERNTKLVEADRMAAEVQHELAHLEGQRRAMRDSRKELERRQRAHLKGAEDSERAAGAAQVGDASADHRRAAEQFRREAAALEPERQEVDRRLAALERPIGEATARLDAAKAELDAAKRSLADAREGHTHRLAELDAEQKRKAREIALAEGEIARRLVTLGTLVNLNRIEDARFDELYQRIDRLRGAITSRTTEIEKLTAEREAYDRGTLVRGVSTIGGAFVLFIALIVILRALL
jgi:hypothetical protein